MANEKNGTAVATENTAAEEMTEKVMDFQLFVERKAARDKFGKPIKTKDGSPIYNYILPYTMRGRNGQIDFGTYDKGGFEPLENVYVGTDRAELTITTVEQEFNGKKTVKTVYMVHNTDEDGVVWSCEVRPARKSDTDLMGQYLNVLRSTHKN